MGRKPATLARQRNGLGAPRLLRFNTKLEATLLREKELRNSKRLKLSKPALPLIAVIEDLLEFALRHRDWRRN